jgi:hypothetical protein
MAFSLPGISELAMSTVSPALSWIWCVSLAMRESAARGSPWDPVHTRQTLASGMDWSFLKSTTSPRGIFR